LQSKQDVLEEENKILKSDKGHLHNEIKRMEATMKDIMTMQVKQNERPTEALMGGLTLPRKDEEPIFFWTQDGQDSLKEKESADESLKKPGKRYEEEADTARTAHLLEIILEKEKEIARLDSEPEEEPWRS